ncbi:DUF4363 family protein [Anaeromicrobium sediminis]|uniref:DUF4363 domain-containing protein n=1 Tax=Anaeromicrobium sediminis TaxID=1478221 RepID=A0A267MHH0_9FIRM|nr:DUF4363 family protein [Anaeromicrobium sediminis]PAB58253.1 hypothetical protein CCE28_16595 [Anaeromicrobium sediminis]
MRTFILCLFIMVLLICVWFYVYSSLEDMYTYSTTQLTELNSLIESDNWNLASIKIEEFEKYIHKKERRFGTLIHHEDMEVIYESVLKLRNHIHYKDKIKSSLEIELLKHFISSAKDNQSLSFYNIF